MKQLTLTLCSLIVAMHSIGSVYAQCTAQMIIKLENTRGGVFANQTVTLTSRAGGESYAQLTNASGEAELTVPCNEVFDVKITNYTKKTELTSPNGGTLRQSYGYPPDLLQKQKLFDMSPEEIAQVNQHFMKLPDTTFMKTSVMAPPQVKPDYSAWVVITLKDLRNGPLANEMVTITGRSRNKSFKGVTDKSGRLLVYLPKGDFYDIGFKYHKGVFNTDCAFTKGTSDIKLAFSYIGTKEVEKRRELEKKRLEEEAKRLEREKEAFEKRCAALGLTPEECHKREIERYKNGETLFEDTVIHVVMKRNNWQRKLIVCDLTGSMHPYIGQLAAWYQLNQSSEKDSQFVFFNDGDEKSDDEKIIGHTGGIYFSKARSYDSISSLMGHVQARGSGGDVAENNIEALMFGVANASAFGDIIMIADNHAPVKDLRLLKNIKTPVHIILCGVEAGNIEPDYLEIAWRTKGSIHTIEEDITKLARLSEGQQVNILGIDYKIVGGEFFSIE